MRPVTGNNVVICLLVASLAIFQTAADKSCDFQISETLQALLSPEEDDSIQIQSLRRQLLHKLQEAIDIADLEDERDLKRNLAALAASNNLPDEQKRNLEALARSGTSYKTLPDSLRNDDANYKRSIANLAKNGQPPLIPLPLPGDQKRGIEALARNGDLHRRQNFRDIRDLMEELYDKRNVESLVRAYGYPNRNGGFGKRTIGSLVRSGNLPYPKRYLSPMDVTLDKRNIQSIKAQSSGRRNKRQVDYSYLDDVLQTYPADEPPYDYEYGLQDLAYPVENKRFLGRLPQMGKPKTTPIPKSRRYH